jgi:outer membrane protein OmpA-like peptidoglycan-associated protein
MFKQIIILTTAVAWLLFAKAEPDTTSARIYFPLNSSNLTPDAKIILNDVPPGDSSITLTHIIIYGNSLTTEKSKSIAQKRANNIKNYLIKLGIQPSIIKTDLITDSSSTVSQKKEVLVVIEIHYNAAIIERTIILKPPIKQLEKMDD